MKPPDPTSREWYDSCVEALMIQVRRWAADGCAGGELKLVKHPTEDHTNRVKIVMTTTTPDSTWILGRP